SPHASAARSDPPVRRGGLGARSERVAVDVLTAGHGRIEKDGRIDMREAVRIPKQPRPHLINLVAQTFSLRPNQRLLVAGICRVKDVQYPNDVGLQDTVP